MSGVKRNILADLPQNGPHSEESLKSALSPENMRRETGSGEEDKAELK